MDFRRDVLQQSGPSAVIAGPRFRFAMSIVFIPFLLFLVLGVARFFIGSVRTKKTVSESRAAHQKRLRIIGAGILISGLLVAASIDMRAILDEEAEAAAPGADRRQFQQNIAGKEGILGTEITEWFLSLGHGRRLAYTVAVASVAGFLTCLFFAHPHLAEPGAAEGQGGTSDP